MNPSVSVIIPAYGVAAYIAEAIDSVLAQSFRNFEVIVVNDGSLDTAELERVLDGYIAEDKIRYITQENRGVAAARNTGIRAAKADLIVVLDGDDILRPAALELWLRMMSRNPRAGMVYGNAMFFGGTAFDGQQTMTHYPSRSNEVTYADLITRLGNVFACAMFRRSVLFEIGLYDEDLLKAEDYDLALRIAKSGAAIENTKDVVYDYRIRPDGLSQSAGDIRSWRIRVLEKHRARTDLSLAEREMIAEELLFQHAEQALDDSTIALRSGDYALAREKFSEANRGKRSMRRIAISGALLLCPGALRRLALFRERRSRRPKEPHR